MEFTPSQIAQITRASVILDSTAPMVRGLAWDSRKIEQGWAYVGMPGERVDGNDFTCAAIQAGATVALMTRQPSSQEREVASDHGCGIMVVPDGEAAIVALASAWRSVLSATVIGVTGSVGKTTSKALIRDVLSSQFRTSATVGNYNNLLGSPYTVLCAPADCEMLVVEMGMDNLGQIEQICQVARPHMGLITNVGTSHLEYLKSRENIARAKAELAWAVGPQGRVFLNGAGEYSDFIREYAQLDKRGVACVRYGDACGAQVAAGTQVVADAQVPGRIQEAPAESAFDVFATQVSLDDQGCPHFVLNARLPLPGADALQSAKGELTIEQAACHLSLKGLHNVTNACGAAAVGLACGMSIQQVAQALSQSQPESGRQEIVRASCGAAVFNDAYNASPESMKAALALLEAYNCSGRRVAVLGDMGELGSSSDQGHESCGAAAAQRGVDWLICVGQRSRLIAQGARAQGMSPQAISQVEDAHQAVELLLAQLEPEDVVLVKASHFMGLDRVVRGIVQSC